jgi:hypothetical protein
LDQAAARAKTKIPDSKPFSLKYKAKGVSDGGFQSLKGSEDGDGSGISVNYSIDPSRQGAFTINEPKGDEALIVIDPVKFTSILYCQIVFMTFEVKLSDFLQVLGTFLKPHQVDGVRFLFRSLNRTGAGFSGAEIQVCIQSVRI